VSTAKQRIENHKKSLRLAGAAGGVNIHTYTPHCAFTLNFHEIGHPLLAKHESGQK